MRAAGALLLVGCSGQLHSETERTANATIDASAWADVAMVNIIDGSTDATSVSGRCYGAIYATAPNGESCDVKRFVRSGAFEGPCEGPPVGSRCDWIGTKLPSDGTVPEGFYCTSQPPPEMPQCAWPFGPNVWSGVIDDNVLNAVCRVLRTSPTAIVWCAVHGS